MTKIPQSAVNNPMQTMHANYRLKLSQQTKRNRPLGLLAQLFFHPGHLYSTPPTPPSSLLLIFSHFCSHF